MPTSISELIHQGHHQSRAIKEVWTCCLSDTNQTPLEMEGRPHEAAAPFAYWLTVYW